MQKKKKKKEHVCYRSAVCCLQGKKSKKEKKKKAGVYDPLSVALAYREKRGLSDLSHDNPSLQGGGKKKVRGKEGGRPL